MLLLLGLGVAGLTHTYCAHSAITISSSLQSKGLLWFACLHTTSIAVAGSLGSRGISAGYCLQTSFACMHTSACNTGSGMHAAANGVIRMAECYPKYRITLFCFAVFDPNFFCAGIWWQEEAAACAQV